MLTLQMVFADRMREEKRDDIDPITNTPAHEIN